MLVLTLISNSGLLQMPVIDPNTAVLFGVKAMFIIAGMLYLLFAVLVTRQISIMSKTVQTTSSVLIKLLGMVHLVASIIALIYFFIVL